MAKVNEIEKLIHAANAQAKIVNDANKAQGSAYREWKTARAFWENERKSWVRQMTELEIQVRMLAGGKRDKPEA